MLRGYAQRLKMAQDVEKLYQPLLEKGYVSKLQVMQATDDRTERGRLWRIRRIRFVDSRNHRLLKAQREAFIQKWHSDTGTELVTVRDDLDVTRQNLEKAQKLSDLSSLDAPADAVVLKVGKVSSGSVAGGGAQGASGQEPLFTLVPLDAPQEAEVFVNARDIGFIKVGDPVQIKLDAYRFLQHGRPKAGSRRLASSFTADEQHSRRTLFQGAGGDYGRSLAQCP